MADIQLIQCKNQQKTSSYRRNSVPHKETGIKESNDDVRTRNSRTDSRRIVKLRGGVDHVPAMYDY